MFTTPGLHASHGVVPLQHEPSGERSAHVVRCVAALTTMQEGISLLKNLMFVLDTNSYMAKGRFRAVRQKSKYR